MRTPIVRVPLAVLSRIRGCVTNNCGFKSWRLDLLDASITVTLDYNSSHIELLLDNESLTVVLILTWFLTSSLLEFRIWLWIWISRIHECIALHNLGRTEWKPPHRTVRLLVSCIRCSGNVWWSQDSPRPRKPLLSLCCHENAFNVAVA
jgi:hypothetical protein